MSIELLYILPALALSLFVFVLLLRAQRASDRRRRERDLLRQVEEFNIGQFTDPIPVREAPEVRLTEIEKTISLVTQALSNQQKVIQGFRGQHNSHAPEIVELKERLRELQREYDIVLSENYSLRARIKKLTQQIENQSGRGKESHKESGSVITSRQQLFDDTREMGNPALEDTHEIDLSQLSG